MDFQGFDGSVHVYSPEAAEGYLQSWGLWGPRWQSAERETCSVWSRLWWIKHTHTQWISILHREQYSCWEEGLIRTMRMFDGKFYSLWKTQKISFHMPGKPETLYVQDQVLSVWDSRWWAVVLTWRGGGVAASVGGGGGRFGVWQGQGHGSRHRGRRRRRQHGGGQEWVVHLPLTTPIGLGRKRTEKNMKTHSEYQWYSGHLWPAGTTEVSHTCTSGECAQQFFAAPSHKTKSAAVRTSPFIIYDPNCSLSLLRPSGPQQFGQSWVNLSKWLGFLYHIFTFTVLRIYIYVYIYIYIHTQYIHTHTHTHI